MPGNGPGLFPVPLKRASTAGQPTATPGESGGSSPLLTSSLPDDPREDQIATRHGIDRKLHSHGVTKATRQRKPRGMRAEVPRTTSAAFAPVPRKVNHTCSNK